MEKCWYLGNETRDFAEFWICCSLSQAGHFEWCWTKIVWLEAEIQPNLSKSQKWPFLKNHALEFVEFWICFRGHLEEHFEWLWIKIVWLEAEIFEIDWIKVVGNFENGKVSISRKRDVRLWWNFDMLFSWVRREFWMAADQNRMVGSRAIIENVFYLGFAVSQEPCVGICWILDML